MKHLSLLFMVFALSLSCKKRPIPASESPIYIESSRAELILEFDNVVNSQPLLLNSAIYINENGDSFLVKSYKYYISNIMLEGENGEKHEFRNSYFLIDQSKPASRKIVLTDMQKGVYSYVSFLIGVDSIKNISGAQTGDLDPSLAMFWDWNTGYIMAKSEGEWFLGGNTFNYVYHIGGYKAPNSVLRTVKLLLPEKITITGTDQKIGVHIKSHFDEWFKNPNIIDFSQASIIVSEGSEAKRIADNYADMFTIDHME